VQACGPDRAWFGEVLMTLLDTSQILTGINDGMPSAEPALAGLRATAGNDRQHQIAIVSPAAEYRMFPAVAFGVSPVVQKGCGAGHEKRRDQR
jgi:hypothetical protein